MDKSILSLFNHNTKKNKKIIIKKIDINILQSDINSNVNKLSLFYNLKCYNKIKNYFTGINIEKYKPANWNDGITNFLKQNKYNITITEESYLQHLDFSQMNKRTMKENIYELLLNPEKFNHLNIDSNFKCKNIELLNDVIYFNELLNNSFMICTNLLGGLGNQLFMLFNLLSLSIDFNLQFKFTFNNGNNIDRKNIIDYNLSKNIKKYYSDNNNKNKNTFNEISYLYNKVQLPKNKNIFINGYYQSYKYFWHNIDKIKKFIHIDTVIIENINNKLININKLNKKILGIHIRLTDYTEKKDYHLNLTIDYYKNALTLFDLDEYLIILFSDDIEEASKYIKPLNINFIKSTDLYDNSDDENIFMLLSLCDSRICCNSSFSLWSCYFNDIFEFNKNAFNIFPNKWFSINGPEYKITDLVPNTKNYIILEQYLTEKIKIIDNTMYLKKKNEKIKIAVIFFHKNIYKLYKKKWIEDCYNSILKQKNVIFDIYEINYGNEDVSIFDNIKLNMKHQFFIKDYDTHTEAMLFLLKQCFDIDNYNIVFNTNLDDYYHPLRFTYQLNNIVDNNIFLNSSLWNYVDENNNILKNINNTIYYKNNKFIWEKNNIEKIYFNNDKINYNVIKNILIKQDNIINHSGVCFTKDYWKSTDKYNNLLRYRNDKPFEDLSLWIRSVQNNIPIDIINWNLIHYRIHNNSIGNSQKKNTKDHTFKNKINLCNFIVGFLLIIQTKDDFKLIKNINENKNYNIFYYVYISDSLKNNFNNLDKKIIYNSKVITFNKQINNINKIIKLFDISIINNSEYFFYIKDNNNYIDIIEKIKDKKFLQNNNSDKVYNNSNNI